MTGRLRAVAVVSAVSLPLLVGAFLAAHAVGAARADPAVGAVLDRAQHGDDRPLVNVGRDLVPSSFRRLGTDSGSVLYLARDRERAVCLVGITPDGQRSATCSSGRGVLRAPLTLVLSDGPVALDAAAITVVRFDPVRGVSRLAHT